MNFLFFDIECASVSKNFAKICAFGYVLCDEQFNIIKKEDILLNPQGGFHLTDRKGSKGLVLPYEYSDFKKYPTFPAMYDKIKELLESSENIVLGHSTLNDIKYLNLETKRFKLPSFKFSFSDSQIIYMSYINNFTRQLGLGGIAAELGVEFTAHRAMDDAYATMKIVEAMCKVKGTDYFTLVKNLGVECGYIKNYNISAPTSQGEKKYLEDKERQKQELSRLRIKLFNYVSRKKSKRDGKYFGKVFCFASDIEDNLNVAKELIDKIYLCGGTYVHHTSKCNFFVADIEDKTPRTLAVLRRPEINAVTLAQLEEMLNAAIDSTP